jgi:hypothetical protein
MASSPGERLEPTRIMDAGIPPPEPALTPQEMFLRAEAMRPILRERQAMCEEIGRLPEETNQEFLKAGSIVSCNLAAWVAMNSIFGMIYKIMWRTWSRWKGLR